MCAHLSISKSIVRQLNTMMELMQMIMVRYLFKILKLKLVLLQTVNQQVPPTQKTIFRTRKRFDDFDDLSNEDFVFDDENVSGSVSSG